MQRIYQKKIKVFFFFMSLVKPFEPFFRSSLLFSPHGTNCFLGSVFNMIDMPIKAHVYAYLQGFFFSSR